MANASEYFEREAFRKEQKTITFDGGTTNGIGDIDGTSNPVTLFTVTGDVKVKVYAICTTNLAGATATLEVGLTGNTASVIAQSTATDIDAGEIWHDATPDSAIELSSVVAEKIIANGADIIATAATANITGGVIRFVCEWRPISSDGNVVAA